MVCAIVLLVHDTVKIVIPPFIRVKGYHLTIDGKSTLLEFINDAIILIHLVILELIGVILMEEDIHRKCLMGLEPVAVQNAVIVDLRRIQLCIQPIRYGMVGHNYCGRIRLHLLRLLIRLDGAS